MKAPSYMSPNRAAELVGHDDEHERGRNDLRDAVPEAAITPVAKRRS